jgi:hypothetical protein
MATGPHRGRTRAARAGLDLASPGNNSGGHSRLRPTVGSSAREEAQVEVVQDLLVACGVIAGGIVLLALYTRFFSARL